jgi:hypothetical protein
LSAALLLAASGILAYFDVAAGVGVAVVGLALITLTRHLALRRSQKALKGLLGKVPVYRQVLERYPRAVVAVPNNRSDSEA